VNHFLAGALCLAGFTALAFAMRRQQREIIGRSLPLATTYLLRTIGAAVLLLVLGILVAWQGWGLGLVMFSGHTSIAAGIVYAVLIAYTRLHERAARHR
jgi:predicted membrane protein